MPPSYLPTATVQPTLPYPNLPTARTVRTLRTPSCTNDFKVPAVSDNDPQSSHSSWCFEGESELEVVHEARMGNTAYVCTTTNSHSHSHSHSHDNNHHHHHNHNHN